MGRHETKLSLDFNNESIGPPDKKTGQIAAKGKELPQVFGYPVDILTMEMSLTSALAQQSLMDQVSTSVEKKGLDQQKIEGQNVLQLIQSSVITDPRLGSKINTLA